MSDEQQGYTLKEVIEKNFSDMNATIRTGFAEVKVDVKEVRLTAEDGQRQGIAANVRLDRYDKHIWFLYSITITALVGGIIALAFKKFGG